MKKLYASTVMKNQTTEHKVNYYETLNKRYGIEIIKENDNGDEEKAVLNDIIDNKDSLYEVLTLLTEKFVMPDTAKYVVEDLGYFND